MRAYEIIDIALENLHKNAGITGKWAEYGLKDLDGQMELVIENQLLKFNTEIKQELRNHQLPKIIDQAQQTGPLMVVANRIFPKIKEELRHNHIAYLEANGNIYLKQGNIMLWLDGQKPAQTKTEKGNRAFTKTGLKVLFHFLLDEQLVQLRYREIAKITHVALGNVNYIMNGLKELNFVIEVSSKTFRLNNKKELLQKWMVAYEERLKPALLMGTFRFLKEEDFLNWKNTPINTAKTKWGGELAGDLYTNYLRPQTLTLYTIESRNELIRNYRLIPDDNGSIKVYKRFWHVNDENTATVPPLLIYADLMNTGDRRCMETAQKIYDGFLQNKL
jgi:hypothetical protein